AIRTTLGIVRCGDGGDGRCAFGGPIDSRAGGQAGDVHVDGERVGVPCGGRGVELLNGDADTCAGSNCGNGGGASTEEVASHGQALSLELNLPPLAV
ncbi:hypothetical protein B1218_39050, partial [Pseudomonas ogarae]